MSNLLKAQKSIISIFFVCIAVFLILPSIMITLYSYPCQDDFHYAFYARELMNQGHDIFTMSIIKTVEYYLTFTGCYTSSFLGYFCSGIINCNIWGIRIFELLSLIIFYIALYIFLYSFSCKVMQFERKKILSLYCLLLACFNCLINYSDHDDFYWFITSIQYLFICSLILFGVSFFIYCIYERDQKKRRISLILACILGFAGSGGTLSIAAFCCELFALVFLWGFFVQKCRKVSCIGMGVTMVGAIINGIAPGNYIRDGKPITIGRVLYAGVQSFRYTLERWETFIKNPVFWIIIVFLVVVLGKCRCKEEKYNYKYPLLFIFVLFCLVAGIIFPTILGYGYDCYLILNRGNFISDMAFYLFIFLALFYVKGWIDCKYPTAFKLSVNRDGVICIVVLVTALLILNRGKWLEVPFVKNYCDLASGKVIEYSEYCIGIYNEIAESQDKVVEIYREEVKDKTCMMNPQFFVGWYDYEKEYANRTIARFYEKDAVYLYLKDANK